MFPEYIDNTMRSALMMCPRKFYYSGVRHLAKHEGTSIHLHAGGAYAFGLETMRKAFYVAGKGPKEALREGKKAIREFWGSFELPSHMKTYKTLERMELALEYYVTHFPLETDFITPHIAPSGEKCIEFKFAIPIPELIHPDTGKPILFCGRCDMICDYSGHVLVEDDKTTGQLGESWVRNWKHDAQPTGYCWAARSLGFPVTGAIIRGIAILSLKEDKDETIIMNTSYGRAQAIVTRAPWEVDRWYEQFVRDIQRAINMYREGYWDFTLDKSACNAYGGCTYDELCSSRDPEPFIENNYVINVWNPLD